MHTVPKNIGDVRELEQRLQELPVETQKFHAARGALRVLPTLDRGVLEARKIPQDEKKELVLTVFRANLTVALSVGSNSAELGAAASRLADRLASFAKTQKAFAGPVGDAASACEAVTLSTPDVAMHAAQALSAHNSAPGVRIAALHKDADRLAAPATLTDFHFPLWAGGPPYPKNWNALRSWLTDNGEWEFWVDWYERHHDGRPQNWDLLEHIALIPDDDWQQGPAHVNVIIAEMVRQGGLDHRGIAREVANESIEILDRHGIGGNAPPEPIVDAPSREEFEALEASLEAVQSELAKNEAPDKAVLAENAKVVVSFWAKVRAWCARHGDTAADSFATEFGKEAGKGLASLMFKLGPKLLVLYAAVQAYISSM